MLETRQESFGAHKKRIVGGAHHSHSHSHLPEYTMSEILNDLSVVPDGALDAVLLKSVEMPEGTPTVRGYDFEGPLDLQKMLDCMMTSGYQATQFGRCVDEVNRMLKWRLSDEPVDDTTDEDERDPAYRASTRSRSATMYCSGRRIANQLTMTIGMEPLGSICDTIVYTQPVPSLDGSTR